MTTNRLCVVTAAAALLLSSLAACSSDGPSSGAAWVACQHTVEANLENPATADFSLMSTTIKTTFIDGTLTAENSFGVERELQFHCDLGGETVTDVDVLPTR